MTLLTLSEIDAEEFEWHELGTVLYVNIKDLISEVATQIDRLLVNDGLDDNEELRSFYQKRVTDLGYMVEQLIPQASADRAFKDVNVHSLLSTLQPFVPVRETARKGGLTKSDARASASRDNGKQGGRPIKYFPGRRVRIISRDVVGVVETTREREDDGETVFENICVRQDDGTLVPNVPRHDLEPIK
jgi:hypothetical protein